MRTLVLPALLAACVASLGCSSNEEPNPAGLDASTSGGTDAGTAGLDAGGPTICEANATLATSPNAVSVSNDALANAPAPVGGTIADGTYVLTKVTWFNDAGQKPQANLKATLKFAGSASVWIRKSGWSSGAEPADADSHRGGGSFTTTGTKIAFNTTCGQTSLASDPTDYTATATSYATIIDNGQTGADQVIAVATYTKQ